MVVVAGVSMQTILPKHAAESNYRERPRCALHGHRFRHHDHQYHVAPGKASGQRQDTHGLGQCERAAHQRVDIIDEGNAPEPVRRRQGGQTVSPLDHGYKGEGRKEGDRDPGRGAFQAKERDSKGKGNQ